MDEIEKLHSYKINNIKYGKNKGKSRTKNEKLLIMTIILFCIFILLLIFLLILKVKYRNNEIKNDSNRS